MQESPIAIIQLANSENIIGPISYSTHPDEESITVEYPMSLMLDPMSGGLGMMPYLAIYTGTLADSKTFSKKHIVNVIEEEDLTPEIIEKYNDYKKQVLDGLKEEASNQPPLPGFEEEEEESNSQEDK